MAELANALAAPVPVTGTDYAFPAVVLDHFAFFETWLEDQAWQGVRRAKVALDDSYDDALKLVSRDVAAQKYCFGGELYDAALRSYHGLKRMFFVVLHDAYPAVTEKWVDDYVKEYGIGELVRILQAAGGL